jgi:hypothetical protein
MSINTNLPNCVDRILNHAKRHAWPLAEMDVQREDIVELLRQEHWQVEGVIKSLYYQVQSWKEGDCIHFE